MLRRIVIATLAGGCLWWAQPTAGVWPLAGVGVALLALSTVGTTIRVGALCGLVCGLAFFVPALRWSGIYVGALPWLALSVLQALYLLLLGAGLALVQRRGRVRPFAGACLWVGMELLRSTTPFGGFPWVRLAFSQADSPLLPLAAIAGAPGLSGAVALVGGLLALLGLRVWHRRRRGLLTPLVTMGVLVTLGLLWPTPTDGRPLTVAGIQGNVPRAGLDFNAQRREVLGNHVRTSDRLVAQVRAGQREAPDLVIWPENSSDIDPTRDATAAREIAAVVQRLNAPTVIGAVMQEPSPKVSNVSLLYLPKRGIVDRYVKRHPVPFGEYIPHRRFFRALSDQVDLVPRDFHAGSAVGLFTIPTKSGTVALAPVICFEVAYDRLTREPIRRGAQLLAVQTNNATFGYSAESEQQLAISRIRAVEHGRAVVHISTVGVSALITPDGAAHQTSRLFTSQVLSGRLPLRSAPTMADRVGSWPEYAASAAAVVLLLDAVRRRRLGRLRGRTCAGGATRALHSTEGS